MKVSCISRIRADKTRHDKKKDRTAKFLNQLNQPLELNMLLVFLRWKKVLLGLNDELLEHLLACSGVMVIVVGIGHGDTSSSPGRDWLDFA